MRALTLVLAAAAGLAAVPQAPAANPCPSLLRLPPAAAAGELALYGHIRSLTRNGARFVLRFDPALLLSGATASQASFEDTGSRDVPNDYYVVDESHRLLTFLVPASAHVTVLARGTCTIPTTVAKLAKSVPPAGFWIRVRIDTVRSLDEQYRP
jgi:hypothetical protein